MSKARDLLSSLKIDNREIKEGAPRRPQIQRDIAEVLENKYFQIAEIAGTVGAILDGVEYLEQEAIMRFSGTYNERKMIGLLNEEFSTELAFRSFRDTVIVETQF
jgi:hypothetical protein